MSEQPESYVFGADPAHPTPFEQAARRELASFEEDRQRDIDRMNAAQRQADPHPLSHHALRQVEFPPPNPPGSLGSALEEAPVRGFWSGFWWGLRRFVFESPQPFIIRTGHYSHRSGEGFQFRGQSLDKPLGVVCATNEKAIVVPHLSQYFGGMVGKDARAPLPTVTARDHNALVAAWLTKWYGTSTGSSLHKPAATVTGGGQHIGAVHAFLVKYFGSCEHGQSLFDSLHTVTSKARFGLVMVEGEPYQLVDIGLRMLSPRELARAQGFPDDYILDGTQAQQIARVGNAVVPQVAEALVRANVLERAAREVG